jgi:CBS domain-containing protein
MNVKSILKIKGTMVETIRPGSTLGAAIDALAQKRIGVLVVSEDGETIRGIISERDIVTGLAKHGASLLDMPVSSMMTQTVKTCSPHESVTDVMEMMTNRRIRHIPVINNDKLHGIVSIGDAVKHRLSELETEAGHLRDYIAH